jgi:hypothetical protein
MFEHFGILALCGLILAALAAAVISALRKYNDSTPLSPVHHGKRHSHDDEHFSCKFDAEEVRRTANQKRPRIELGDRESDPKVAAILAAISQGDIEKALRELSGELEIKVGGKTVKLGGRNTYTDDLSLAQLYLEQFYAGLGLKVERHTYKVRGRTLSNLIIEFRGAVNPKKVLYLGAHLDSTAGWPWSSEAAAPGADDDASGTVALMEIAKVLVKMKPGCSVRLCHFTGEEQGLYGSYAYSDKVSKIADETVIGMIEMDMIAYCNRPGNRVDVHDDVDRNGSHSLVVTLTQAAARYNLNLNVFDTHNHAVQDRSDHAGFLDHGYKAVLVSEEFSDEGFNPMYHSTGDKVSNCNLPFMLDVIRMVLAATIDLAEVK